MKEFLKTSVDILKDGNYNVWGGVEVPQKVRTIVKTSLSEADLVIRTSHALDDFAFNDKVCWTLDIVRYGSSGISRVLGKIPAIKKLTIVTGSGTLGYRAIRVYWKRYGLFCGCTVAAGEGVRHIIKFA